MSLDAEIAADFLTMLDDYGVDLVFQGTEVLCLASQVRTEQELDLGGIVSAPDLKVKFPKDALDPLPAHGSLVTVDGEDYRVSKVSAHPRSPLLTLELISPHEG